MSVNQTNRDRVLNCIRNHPDGLDDDQVSAESGVVPRQQVYQIATRLAEEGLIRRDSVVKPGKRRKIHNFPASESADSANSRDRRKQPSQLVWQRRLAALVAATGKEEAEILDQALLNYARDLVQNEFE